MISSAENQAFFEKRYVNIEPFHGSSYFPDQSIHRDYQCGKDLDEIAYKCNKEMKPAHRMVLKAIAALANKYGAQLRVSRARFAKMAGVSLRSTTSSFKFLKEKDYIRTYNHGGIPLTVLANELLDANFSGKEYFISFNKYFCADIKEEFIYNNVTLRNLKNDTTLPSVPYRHASRRPIQGEARGASLGYGYGGTVAPRPGGEALLRLGYEGQAIVSFKTYVSKTVPFRVESMIPSYIDEISELDLKNIDKIQLSAYPEPVVTYVRKELAKQTGLNNRIGWFMAACKKAHERFKQTGSPEFKSPYATQSPKIAQEKNKPEPKYPYSEWKPTVRQPKELTEQKREAALESVKQIKDPFLRELLLKQHNEKVFAQNFPARTNEKEKQQLAMAHTIKRGLPEMVQDLATTYVSPRVAQVQQLQNAGQAVVKKYDLEWIADYDEDQAEREYKRLTNEGVNIEQYINDISGDSDGEEI
jgi:hypothetical protein